MKILYLHQYFTTPDSGGGTRSYEMARRLARDGHDVHVVTSDAHSSGIFWRHTQIAGFTVHTIPVRYDNSMGIGRRIWAFIAFALLAGPKACAIGGDLVFATSTPLTIAIPGVLTKKIRRIPMVLEIRDSWPTVPIAMGALNNRMGQIIARRLEKWSCAQADRIIALSDDMKDGVTRLGVHHHQVTVIPNGSDRALFDVDTKVGESFRKEYGWLGDRPLVVYTGAFGRVNGLSYMVHLAKATREIDPEIRFLAVGDGAQFEQVRNLAERFGLLDDTMFVWPAVPKTEIVRILSAASAASSWVVNIRELHGNSANKLFDAFAAGRPMLVNHGGWQSDLLTLSGAGLALDPVDYEEAATELVNFLRSEATVSDARAQSMRLGHDVFDRDLLYNAFLSVLLDASTAYRRHVVP
jgi:glycosyltransferase involved in cell wall biosynthesis